MLQNDAYVKAWRRVSQACKAPNWVHSQAPGLGSLSLALPPFSLAAQGPSNKPSTSLSQSFTTYRLFLASPKSPRFRIWNCRRGKTEVEITLPNSAFLNLTSPQTS